MKDWISRAARIGYAAKGITYILIAILALQAAWGTGHAENTPGALKSVDGPPGGRIVLLLIGVGLGAYALWKLYLVYENPEDDGWGKRSTALFVAFTNGGFAFQAITLALHLGAQNSDKDQAQHWSAVALAHPSGAIAVGLAGVFVGGYGLGQFVRALRRKVDEHLRHMKIERTTKQWIIFACKFGIAARGVVFTLVGWFLMRAAVDYNPSEARDFGNVMNELRQHVWGRTGLGVVAFGLLAYAIYQFLRARFDRFPA